MSDTHKCPRRVEAPPGWAERMAPNGDTWEVRKGGMNDGVRSCSYCGSMHPDDFMQAMRDGKQVGPTDKSYKAYVDDHAGKFYYQHLSQEQRDEFIQLYNDKKLNIGYPGHFYVLPFFCRYGETPED